MIVQLQGILQDLDDTHCVVVVQGVGYCLGISSRCAHAIFPQMGQEVTLFTRMIVKENAIELYGFESVPARSAFDRLIAISSIGPKLALAILSTYSVSDLKTIASTKDIDRMSLVSGVGKKKAARILVELADSFSKDKDLVAEDADAAGADARSSAPASDPALIDEAKQALLSMGFTTQEIELAQAHLDISAYASLSTLISATLKRLGGDR